MVASIQQERERQHFGQKTRRAVEVFQRERQFQSTGEVDKQTARVINAHLCELELLEEPSEDKTSVLSVFAAPLAPVALATAGIGLVSGTAIPDAEWLLDWWDDKKSMQENGLHYLLRT